MIVRKALPVLLLLVTSLAGCGGTGGDSDGDGISDSLEEEGWATHAVIFMDRSELVRMKSDPSLVDTDGDGLTDQEELLARTNPRAKDTDQDGLTDCQELFHTNATECEDPNFDVSTADGGYGTNPLNADSDGGPTRYKPTQPFQDNAGAVPSGSFGFGDGVSDGDEIYGYQIQLGPGRIITVTSDPLVADTDGDGLEDGEEQAYGGNPRVMDTDGDGCDDSKDPWPGAGESYSLGLRTFTLKAAPEGSSSRIQFSMLLLDEVKTFPTNGLTVQVGETVDITSLDVTIDHAGRCNTSPYDPWAKVQVVAFDMESAKTVDVWGLNPSESFSWNTRTGQYRWADAGKTVVAGDSVMMSGSHGDLLLAPIVSGV